MNVTIPCPCPPKADGATRHESDTVTLMDPLPFRQHLILANTIPQVYRDDPDASVPELIATLIEAYVLNCIGSWTLVDDKDKAVPVTKADIRERLLPHYEAAALVGDAADDLYSERVTAPLVQRASSSWESPSLDESTSPPTDGGSPTAEVGNSTSKRRKSPTPSKPSSTSTTPTDGIVTTASWHGGVSRSSPSTATAS